MFDIYFILVHIVWYLYLKVSNHNKIFKIANELCLQPVVQYGVRILLTSQQDASQDTRYFLDSTFDYFKSNFGHRNVKPLLYFLCYINPFRDVTVS